MKCASGGEDRCVRVGRFTREAEGWSAGYKALTVDAKADSVTDFSFQPDAVVESQFARIVNSTQVAPQGIAGDRFRFVRGPVQRSTNTET